MSSSTLLPRLHPPVRERWRTRLPGGSVRRQPVTNGTMVAIAVHDRLTALDAATGQIAWTRRQSRSISEIQACGGGPVVTLREGEDLTLAAFGWDGQPLWRIGCGINGGDDCLRGQGAYLIAVGQPTGPSTRQICQVRDAPSGRLILEFPCEGDPPELFGDRLIWSSREWGGGEGGLWAYGIATRTKHRLLDTGHGARAIDSGVAILETSDDDNRFGRMLAVDLETSAVLWEDAGGPNFSLSAADGLVASMVAADDTTAAMTLRDVRTGRRLWTAAPVTADYAVPLLAGDCVLATVDGKRLETYDRRDGALIDVRAKESGVVEGGILTQAGFVDIAGFDAICLAGAAP